MERWGIDRFSPLETTLLFDIERNTATFDIVVPPFLLSLSKIAQNACSRLLVLLPDAAEHAGRRSGQRGRVVVVQCGLLDGRTAGEERASGSAGRGG